MSSTPCDGVRHRAILTLAVDAQTARVMSTLVARNVDALLLKGPAVARLLYADGELRHYGDTDLLVSPPTLAAAEGVLRELGYERDVGDRSVALIGDHGYAWRQRTSRMAVDLHHTLPGVAGSPRRLWAALRPHTVSMQVQGTSVLTLTPPALAFHVALHAAHHGIHGEKSLRDLERALNRIRHDEWMAAAALADDVDATDAFGTGLRMLPHGAALANELRVPASNSRRAALAAMAAPHAALAADRLCATPGARAKAMLLLRKAFPPADIMRLGWPLARKGRWRLALAYPCRLVMFACQVAPAVLAWRKAGCATARPRGSAPS